MSSAARLVSSCAALSAWLVFLLVGWVFGGAVHLLLVAALALFPWSAARFDDAGLPDESEVPEEPAQPSS